MPSARYRALEQRIQQLEKRLLPPKSATGSYSPLQLDLVRGYRLLAHAEIEAYLEDKARLCANESLRRFRVDSKPRTVVMTLLAFHSPQKGVSAKQLKEIYANRIVHVQDTATQATTSYNRVISQNNGIKESNILQLLLPLGFRHSEIDSTWLSTIDSFGVKRGETAHSSFRAQAQPDPVTEQITVQQILAGLLTLDKRIKELR
jgi:hypothetical protein